MSVPDLTAALTGDLAAPDLLGWRALADLCEERGQSDAAALWRARAAWLPPLREALDDTLSGLRHGGATFGRFRVDMVRRRYMVRYDCFARDPRYQWMASWLAVKEASSFFFYRSRESGVVLGDKDLNGKLLKIIDALAALPESVPAPPK
jgi:hypothetical protein